MLARHLLSREELVLKPGQTTTLKNVLDGDAHVFGVVAAYQDIDHATWRAVGLLTEGQVNAFNVELARRAVSLQTLPRQDETEKQSKDKKEEKGEK